MKDIAAALKKFVKEDHSSTALLLDEHDIPLPSFIHQNIQAPNIPNFFGEKTKRVDFDYISSIYLMDFQITHPHECYGSKNPFACKFNIPPVLDNDNIIYAKEGDLLYQISIDKKNPCFQKIDLKTNQATFVHLSKVNEIATRWMAQAPEKAADFAAKVVALAKRTPKSLRVNPKKRRTLPHFCDIYRFYALKEAFTRDATQLREISTTFDIHPVLTQGGRAIYKKHNFYYKIELGDEIKFERFSTRGHCVMTRNEAVMMLNAMKQTSMFGAKTPLVCNALMHYYCQKIEPNFTSKDQIKLMSAQKGSSK